MKFILSNSNIFLSISSNLIKSFPKDLKMFSLNPFSLNSPFKFISSLSLSFCFTLYAIPKYIGTPKKLSPISFPYFFTKSFFIS